MIARIIQGTANGYSVCHGHHREVLSLAAVSQKARSHSLQTILACPRKNVCPIFRRQSCCMFGRKFYTCNMRIIGLSLVGYNYSRGFIAWCYLLFIHWWAKHYDKVSFPDPAPVKERESGNFRRFSVFQIMWHLPNCAPVPRKSTKVSRPSFRVAYIDYNVLPFV